MFDVIGGGPIRGDFTNPQEEVADDVDPTLGVKHLRMKLNAVEVALAVFDDREGRVVCRTDGIKSGRQPRHLVAVRIPHLQFARQTVEQAAGFSDG